jgi:hypothetical protein
MFRVQAALIPPLTRWAVRRKGIRQEGHLHGIRDWAAVWDNLIRDVEAAGVRRIELAINLPAAGEVYHGHWSLPSASGDAPAWSVVHTLHAGGVPAGILRVAGSVDGSRPRHLHKVEELVLALEGRLGSDLPSPAPSAVASPSYVNLPVTAPLG